MTRRAANTKPMTLRRYHLITLTIVPGRPERGASITLGPRLESMDALLAAAHDAVAAGTSRLCLAYVVDDHNHAPAPAWAEICTFPHDALPS